MEKENLLEKFKNTLSELLKTHEKIDNLEETAESLDNELGDLMHDMSKTDREEAAALLDEHGFDLDFYPYEIDNDEESEDEDDKYDSLVE